MNHYFVRWVAVVAMVVVVGAGPVRTEAGASSDNLLELAAKGGPSLGLSFGVLPLHLELIPPPETGLGSAAESRMPTDAEPRGRAVSFDLKLKWPTGELPIEPYLVLGPALFVDQPHEMSGLIGIPADPILRLGAKAGAGFNWRLGKDATLFGSYDLTTSTVDRFSVPGKGSAAGGSVGHDLLYGVRFGF